MILHILDYFIDSREFNLEAWHLHCFRYAFVRFYPPMELTWLTWVFDIPSPPFPIDLLVYFEAAEDPSCWLSFFVERE